MDNTVIYIIVFIALAHFIVAVVYLLRKLTGPVKDESAETPPAQPGPPSASGADTV